MVKVRSEITFDSICSLFLFDSSHSGYQLITTVCSSYISLTHADQIGSDVASERENATM